MAVRRRSWPLTNPYNVTDRPIVGVGGVVIRNGRVLLIRRSKPPLSGRWMIPGGTVELGETLEQAVVREIEEETQLRARPVEMLGVFDWIESDEEGVRYHFVIVDYLCRCADGAPQAGSDASAAAWASLGELTSYDLPEKAEQVVRDGFARLDKGSGLHAGSTLR